MNRDFWVPGAAQPSLADFVENVHRQIERYTEAHTAERTHVEVELGDGERLALVSLSGEPGYGFLTLSVYAGDGEAEDHIVPIGAIRRIALGPADESRRPGFALPKERGPDPAA